MPVLSVVIPNYNYGHFADRFFGSIAAQTLPLSGVEILFVDDGSTDDSLARARHWGGRLDCARFAVLAPPRSGRPGLVRNAGLEHAQGEFLLTLDPDDTLHPEYLERCVTTLSERPEVDLVFTDYVERTPEGDREVHLPDFKPVGLRMQNVLPPTGVYRRHLWDSGVRYRANTDYEDWDYWIQCQSAGAKFLRIPEALYDYRHHGANFSNRAQKNDGPAKAQIVLNNPSFFHPQVVDWARGVLRGRLHSQAFRRGCIPRPEDVRELLKVVERMNLKVSGF